MKSQELKNCLSISYVNMREGSVKYEIKRFVQMLSHKKSKKDD